MSDFLNPDIPKAPQLINELSERKISKQSEQDDLERQL